MTDLFYETTDISLTDPSNEINNVNMKAPFSETNNQKTTVQSADTFDVGMTAPSKGSHYDENDISLGWNINSADTGTKYLSSSEKANVSQLVSFTDAVDEITRVSSLEVSDMKSSAQSDIETDVETTALFKGISKRETADTSYVIARGKISDPSKKAFNANTAAPFNDATDSEITTSSSEANNPDTAVHSINITETETTAL
ncbi:hypothetical protein Aperf_G00000123885 [Anoplocephala perfoliata]